MCLISKWRFPKIAKEDIVCYKLLIKLCGSYRTPFRNIVVDTSKPLIAEGNSIYFTRPHLKDAGYIHTFIDDKYHFCDSGEYLWKCIIPKGTKYHESTNCREYCSRKIIFITKVM